MNRAERRRRQRAHGQPIRRPSLEPDVCVLVAWCAGEEDLEECRRATHDALIALMGTDRTGPVSWRWYEGEEAMATMEHLLAEPGGPELADHYRRVRGHLREWGGFVVLTSAPGVRR